MTKFGELLDNLLNYPDSWTYSTTGWGRGMKEYLLYKQHQEIVKYKWGNYTNYTEILKINVTCKFDFDVGSSSVLSLEDKQALWDKFEALRVAKGGPERANDEFNMRKVQDKTRTANRNRLFKKVFNTILGTTQK